MLKDKNIINKISKQIESELNNVINDNLSEDVEVEIISKIEQYYNIEINKIEDEMSNIENIDEKSILLNLEKRYQIKLNKNISIVKINDYIREITNTIQSNQTKLKLEESRYIEEYNSLLHKNQIEEVSLIDKGKKINKKENSILLHSLDTKKWWSIGYWLNKSKIKKKEEENKKDYKNKEDEIIEILKLYKENTLKQVKEIEYLKDIVDEETYININKSFKISESIEKYLYSILNILNEYKVSIDNLIKRKKDIENYKINEIYKKIADEYKNIKVIKDDREEINIEIKEEVYINSDKQFDLIEDYFQENTYNLFVAYCTNKGFKYMSDIEAFDFDILLEERGFGVGKIKKLKEKYEYYRKENNIEIDIIQNAKIKIEKMYIHDYYKNKDIDILEVFGVKSGVIEKLKKQINTIGELAKESKTNVSKIEGVGKTKVDVIYDKLELLSKSPKEVFNITLLDIKSDKNFEILNKRSEDKTLQEVGHSMGVTRERVRQLEAKLVSRLVKAIDIFDQYIIEELGSNQVLHQEDLQEIIEDKDMINVALNYLKKDICKRFKYFDEIEKIIVDIDEDNLRNKFYEISEELDEIFNINDENIDIEEILLEEELTYISKEDFITFLINTDYKRKGNYLIKGQVNKGRVYSYVVKEFFKDGIRFNIESDINKLKDILEIEFDMLDEDESERAIKANVERTCILRNTSTYTHPDNVDVDTKILRKIKKYIDDNQMSTLYITDIYEEFKEELNKNSNIDTKEYLHGAFKYFYGEYYSFTRDTIYKGEEKATSSQMIEDYLKNKDRFVTKSELKEQFKGWTEIMFTVAIENNKNILQWDHNKYTLINNVKITEKDKTILAEILRNQILKKDGYTNSALIFEVVKSEYPEFIQKNNIKVAYSLYSIIKYLFEDAYNFKRLHIALNEIDIELTNIGVLKYLLKDRVKFTKDEVNYICKELKMKESTRHAMVEELLIQCEKINDEYILGK